MWLDDYVFFMSRIIGAMLVTMIVALGVFVPTYIVLDYIKTRGKK